MDKKAFNIFKNTCHLRQKRVVGTRARGQGMGVTIMWSGGSFRDDKDGLGVGKVTVAQEDEGTKCR